jgi:hypothetical protein
MKPYGYVRKDSEGLFIYGEHQFQNAMGAELVPVYLHPKEWVGLTEDERDHLTGLHLYAVRGQVEAWIEGVDDFAQAIEQALKEKNT